MKHSVYIGVGSNIDPRRHVVIGLEELSRSFRITAVSSVYQSDAVGFEGDPFLNLVVAVETGADLPHLVDGLREIEFRYGRTAASGKYSSRHLDIDLLTYDEEFGEQAGVRLPRGEITVNAFVLCPFAEIAADRVIPGQVQTLAKLWQDYDRTRQPLKRIPFTWRNRSLPIRRLPQPHVDEPAARIL